ncbi:hypothetical protein, partial [Diplocloster hominis]|uniref:hypothetical protein n=1 Tax=Diplocloster hominis TaxID=3079010 RepID=UPI0031BB9E05
MFDLITFVTIQEDYAGVKYFFLTVNRDFERGLALFGRKAKFSSNCVEKRACPRMLTGMVHPSREA